MFKFACTKASDTLVEILDRALDQPQFDLAVSLKIGGMYKTPFHKIPLCMANIFIGDMQA